MFLRARKLSLISCMHWLASRVALRCSTEDLNHVVIQKGVLLGKQARYNKSIGESIAHGHMNIRGSSPMQHHTQNPDRVCGNLHHPFSHGWRCVPASKQRRAVRLSLALARDEALGTSGCFGHDCAALPCCWSVTAVVAEHQELCKGHPAHDVTTTQ
eukprot:1143009-Pelagomonas_calceolata.AAC.6